MSRLQEALFPWITVLYLPILLFDFGTSQQTVPVFLRQNHNKKSFCDVSSQKDFSL